MTHLSQLTNGKVSASDLGNGLVNLAGLDFTGVALAGIFNLFAPGPEGYHGFGKVGPQPSAHVIGR